MAWSASDGLRQAERRHALSRMKPELDVVVLPGRVVRGWGVEADLDAVVVHVVTGSGDPVVELNEWRLLSISAEACP